MGVKEDISNKRFNNLVALEPLYLYNREWVWRCICDCGKETKVRISKLKNGTTKSCGCHKAKNLTYPQHGKKHGGWEGYGDISKSYFSQLRESATIRKHEFNITIEYLWELFNSQGGKCIYTGLPLKFSEAQRWRNHEDNENAASLDRINSALGYVEGNLQWVCKRINYMKHTMTHEYFLSLVEKIYLHIRKNEEVGSEDNSNNPS